MRHISVKFSIMFRKSDIIKLGSKYFRRVACCTTSNFNVIACQPVTTITLRYKSSLKSKSKFDEKRFENEDVEISKGSIDINPALCSGCGATFQSSYPNSSGYLSSEKMAEHLKRMERRKAIKDALRVLNVGGIDVKSDAAVEILKEAEVSQSIINEVCGLDVTKTSSDHPIEEKDVEEEVVDMMTAKMEKKKHLEEVGVNICQRCYRLKQYGSMEQGMRPGWSATSPLDVDSTDIDDSFNVNTSTSSEGASSARRKDANLDPNNFIKILSSVKNNVGVILCLIDVFDLSGSVVRNLKEIAGKNPIVIGANKVDILPSNVPHERLKTWVYDELRDQCGLITTKEKQVEMETYKRNMMTKQGWYEPNAYEVSAHSGVLLFDNIHLISCTTGSGVKSLIQSCIEMAQDHDNTVYVLGTANVGKSSFINHIIDTNSTKEQILNRAAGSRNSVLTKYKSPTATPQTTVSNIPGTTLNTIKITLPKHNTTFIDTPGLLNKSQLTTYAVTTNELQYVIPKTPINRITHRLREGKVVLIGGYSRVELTEGKPFFFTFFVSNELKLHPTDRTRADEIISKHIGSMLFPPHSMERIEEIGPLEDHYFEINGDSWTKGTADIVIAGLGWVCITGPGLAKVRVSAPRGVAVTVRKPLLPYEAWQSTASFSGGRWLQKQSPSNAKNIKNKYVTGKKTGVSRPYGWRA